jgi:hypothetical protein
MSCKIASRNQLPWVTPVRGSAVVFHMCEAPLFRPVYSLLCYCALLPATARCRAALKRWSLEAASKKKGSLVSAESVERSSFRLAEYTSLIYLINYPDHNLTLAGWHLRLDG